MVEKTLDIYISKDVTSRLFDVNIDHITRHHEHTLMCAHDGAFPLYMLKSQFTSSVTNLLKRRCYCPEVVDVLYPER